MMSFGLQWGVAPILSSSWQTNVPVTLSTLFSSPFFSWWNFISPPLPLSPIFPLSSPLPLWKLIHTYLLHFIPPPSPLPSPSPHQDHDKTQEEVLKHQASISQLKRSFMEAPPPSPPQLNQWEKRLTSSPATIRIQQQQVVRPPGCVLWKEAWLCRIFVRNMCGHLH